MRTLIAPLVGGVIGYITNDLAIRMLFRPRKAYYIGKFHIPFTPGLIPSRKGALAQSIGNIVSDQLLNEETLRQTLLSEEAVEKLRERIRALVRGFSEDRRTISGLLDGGALPGNRRIDVNALQRRLTDALAAKIVEAKLGYAVIDSTLGEKTDVITHNKLFTAVIGDETKEAVKKKLAELVDGLIAERAPDVARAVVAKYRAELLDLEIREIYEKYKDREDQLIRQVTDLYVSLLGDNLGRLLRAINIEQIVVDKINGLDAAQLETVVFSVMRQELRAIVWLGALLGFLMGFINLLI